MLRCGQAVTVLLIPSTATTMKAVHSTSLGGGVDGGSLDVSKQMGFT